MKTKKKAKHTSTAIYLVMTGILMINLLIGCDSNTSFPVSISGLPETERVAAVDCLMQSGISFPLITNDSTVHFLFRGEAESVKLAGDMTNWNPSGNFLRIPGTDLWYLTAFYPVDARLDYKFVINDTTWILDPKNPDTCLSGYGPNSTFHMPGYTKPPKLTTNWAIPHGTLKDTIISSDRFGSDRRIILYFPAGYSDSSPGYPVMYFHDGEEFLTLAKTASILDYLIAFDFIEPLIGVFIPPVDREPEYVGILRDDYTSFVTEELVPAIDKAYNTRKSPAGRGMTGISNGGYISLYIGIRHPGVFRHVASQSGSFSEELFGLYSTMPDTTLSLYIDMGKYDIPELVVQAEAFIRILKKEEYDFTYLIWPEGHSWGNWQAHLRNVLIRFFPDKNIAHTSQP